MISVKCFSVNGSKSQAEIIKIFLYIHSRTISAALQCYFFKAKCKKKNVAAVL